MLYVECQVRTDPTNELNTLFRFFVAGADLFKLFVDEQLALMLMICSVAFADQILYAAFKAVFKDIVVSAGTGRHGLTRSLTESGRGCRHHVTAYMPRCTSILSTCRSEYQQLYKFHLHFEHCLVMYQVLCFRFVTQLVAYHARYHVLILSGRRIRCGCCMRQPHCSHRLLSSLRLL